MIQSPPPEPTVARASRCWTLVDADGGADVELTAPDDATLRDITSCLRKPGTELPVL